MKNVTITAKENYPVIQHRLEIIHDFKNQITLKHFLMVLSEHAFLLRKPDAFGILDLFLSLFSWQKICIIVQVLLFRMIWISLNAKNNHLITDASSTRNKLDLVFKIKLCICVCKVRFSLELMLKILYGEQHFIMIDTVNYKYIIILLL